MIECCEKYLIFAGSVEYHEWDEVFGTEITTLLLNMYQCEFCERVYYLAI